MKRVVVILLLALFSVSAYSQTHRGDSSFGLNLGYGFDSENFTLGIDYRFNVTDGLRLVPSLTHFVKNDGLSAWAIDLNAHYVFPLGEYFGFYPLAGVDLTFWKQKVLNLSHNQTRFGGNIGLGGEIYASPQFTVGLEVKYNIVKDYDQAWLGLRLGYNF